MCEDHASTVSRPDPHRNRDTSYKRHPPPMRTFIRTCERFRLRLLCLPGCVLQVLLQLLHARIRLVKLQPGSGLPRSAHAACMLAHSCPAAPFRTYVVGDDAALRACNYRNCTTRHFVTRWGHRALQGVPQSSRIPQVCWACVPGPMPSRKALNPCPHACMQPCSKHAHSCPRPPCAARLGSHLASDVSNAGCISISRTCV